MNRYTRRDWTEAAVGLSTIALWVWYLFGPAGGNLMP